MDKQSLSSKHVFYIYSLDDLKDKKFVKDNVRFYLTNNYLLTF